MHPFAADPENFLCVGPRTILWEIMRILIRGARVVRRPAEGVVDSADVVVEGARFAGVFPSKNIQALMPMSGTEGVVPNISDKSVCREHERGISATSSL